MTHRDRMRGSSGKREVAGDAAGPSSRLSDALIGLAIEAAETPGLAANRSAQDVARATRLALYELNGFPDWASDLWVANPGIAEPIFRDEIHWEFSRKRKHGPVHHVVATLAYAKEPFRSLA